MTSKKPQLVQIQDDLGHQWTPPTRDVRASRTLAVGATVQLQTAASDDVMYGFAVGYETAVVTEWADAGQFKFHVLERYESKGLRVHVGIRRPHSSGRERSDWLGPVDDLWVLDYKVAARQR